MAPEVLETLIGRVPEMVKPAFLPAGFTRHPVKGQVYPGVISNTASKTLVDPPVSLDEIKESCVKGVLLKDISVSEMEMFDYFEDEDYERLIVPVYTYVHGENHNEIQQVDAHTYIWCAGDSLLHLEKNWSYDHFREQFLSWYLTATVGPCHEDFNTP